MKPTEFLALLIFISLTKIANSYQCETLENQMTKPPHNQPFFLLEISGNPKTYVANQSYIVGITTNPKISKTSKFRSFSIEAEPSAPTDDFVKPSAGRFTLSDELSTSFSPNCRSTVREKTAISKSTVQVIWIAPPTKSGCVTLKATVVETEENWFAPEDTLKKILCEDEDAESEFERGIVLQECCACDEAKYEIAFQGQWTRNTHPNKYPKDPWLTKFSDIIGASHHLNREFWRPNSLPSEGMKSLAKDGDTNLLEADLKNRTDHVRTIIKARELAYPNITGTSYTVVRVDKDNHLLSLVSKITPSPDWIVGVANLELCLPDCTWVNSRTIPLFPYDVGVDDAMSYTDPPIEPAIETIPIRSITSNSPAREESPFYDKEGRPMKPLAILTVRREKIYPKDCDAADNDYSGRNREDEDGGDCRTGDWTAWSDCDDECYQFRSRNYVNSEAESLCHKKMNEERLCKTPECKDKILSADDDKCALNDWEDWSACSVKCGTGHKTKGRTFKQPQYRRRCEAGNDEIELERTEECEGDGEDCEGQEQTQQECEGMTWGAWSECLCDSSTKIRYREPVENEERRRRQSSNEEENVQDDYCSINNKEEVECSKPICYEGSSPQDNSFGTIQADNLIDNYPKIVSQGPVGPVIDCEVSRFSIFGPCEGSCVNGVRKGYREKHRQIKVHAFNGGKPCPKKLTKRKKCTVSCSNNGADRDRYETSRRPRSDSHRYDDSSGEIRDCILGSWTKWSPCTATCGPSALRVRTRPILQAPSKNGRACGLRQQVENCRLPVSCNKRLDC